MVRLRGRSVIVWFTCIGVSLGIASGVAGVATRAQAAELTLVEDESDPTTLLGARFAALSPDGKHLYVAVPSLDAIRVYTRSAVTGTIAPASSVVDGAGGVDGLDGVTGVALSPAGDSLYSVGPEGVGVFARNDSTGALSFVETEVGGPGRLFRNPTGAAVHASGSAVYVSSYDDSSVAWFTRAGDGSLDYVDAIDRVMTPQPGLLGADCVIATSDGKDAYVCGALDRAIVYARSDPLTGTLSPNGFVPEYFVPGGAQVPLHGVTEAEIAPGGLFLYAAVDFARSIVAFTRDPNTGFLFHLQTVADGAAAGGSRGPQSVRVHPRGDRLYASVLDAPTAQTGALTVFSRNVQTGELALLETLEGQTTPGLGWSDPGVLAIAPDGAQLYVPDGSGFVKVLAIPEPLSAAATSAAIGAIAWLRRRR